MGTGMETISMERLTIGRKTFLILIFAMVLIQPSSALAGQTDTKDGCQIGFAYSPGTSSGQCVASPDAGGNCPSNSTKADDGTGGLMCVSNQEPDYNNMQQSPTSCSGFWSTIRNPGTCI